MKTIHQELHLIAEVAQFDNDEAVERLLDLAKNTGYSLFRLSEAVSKKHECFADGSNDKYYIDRKKVA